MFTSFRRHALYSPFSFETSLMFCLLLFFFLAPENKRSFNIHPFSLRMGISLLPLFSRPDVFPFPTLFH